MWALLTGCGHFLVTCLLSLCQLQESDHIPGTEGKSWHIVGAQQIMLKDGISYLV